MATFTKMKLSGSTNGKPIKISAVATLGDTIHTAVSGTSSWDEIWLYAYNHHTASVDLTIEWGGATVPDDIIQVSIPAKSGLQLIVPGNILQNGLLVTAFASVTAVVTIHGFVNRIS